MKGVPTTMTFSIQTAKREAGRAIKAWLVIYFIAFLLLLLYRLDTKRYYVSKHETQKKKMMMMTTEDKLVVSNEEQSTSASEAKKQKNVVYREPSLAPYETPLRELTVELESATNILNRNLQQLQQQLASLKSVSSDTEKFGIKFDALVSSRSRNNDIGKKDPNDDDHDDDDNVLSFDSLRSLLSLRGLHQIEDGGRLRLMFQKATSELKSFREKHVVVGTTTKELRKSTLDDTEYMSSLLAEMADRTRDPSDVDGTCMAPLLQASKKNKKKKTSQSQKKKLKKKKGLHPDAVSVEDVDRYIQEFDWLFQRRAQGATTGISAVSPDNEAGLMEEIDIQIGEMIDELITQAQDLIHQLKVEIEEGEEQDPNVLSSDNNDGTTTTTTTTTSTSLDEEECVDKFFVYSLVEAGIQAQFVGDDVREALLKRMVELKPETANDDSLILDADLPLSNNKAGTSSSSSSDYRTRLVSSSSSSSSTINLRDVIETPVLIKSIDWIDQFVELIGGYNDDVDRYLDSITEYGGTNNNGGGIGGGGSSSSSSSSSVGMVVIQRVLEHAGLINVNPQTVIEQHLPSSVSDMVSRMLGTSTPTSAQ